MAVSPTPKPRPAPNAEAVLSTPLQQALAAWDGALRPIAVACSGGADSVALLLSAHQRWPGQVVALHVNHGLQAAAADFQRLVERLCDRLGVSLFQQRVLAAHSPGESPEEAARTARYRALSVLAQEAGAGVVLLAQHADDQAETVMLALTRGAGVAGLAAMPGEFERHGTRFGRPWLAVRGAALRAWLADQGQAWCEDPSNQDTRYARNRLRHGVLAQLETAFPGFVQCAGRTAAHCAQANTLLNELAALDLERTGNPPAIARLQELTDERLANALRYWLRGSNGAGPSTAQLHELMSQVRACRTRGHRIAIKVGAGQVQRQGEHLAYLPPI